jgi:hypothetical protein
MTTRDLAHTLDTVANQMQVVAGLTTEVRRTIGADAQRLVDLEGAVNRVIRLLQRRQPPHAEAA